MKCQLTQLRHELFSTIVQFTYYTKIVTFNYDDDGLNKAEITESAKRVRSLALGVCVLYTVKGKREGKPVAVDFE